MRTYKIRHWSKTYEVSDARRSGPGKALPWVAIPTKHDGRGYRKLMSRADGMQLFAAFVLMVQVAAKMPTRGVLENDDGPLDAEYLHDKTGGSQEVFQTALEVLSNKSLGIFWVEVSEDTSEYPEVGAPTYETRRNDTIRNGTDETDGSAEADAPPPAKGSKHVKPKVPKTAHHRAVEHFHRRYEEKYGVGYDFAAGKDGAHVKWMLERCGGDANRLGQIFDQYLENDDTFYVQDRHSLGMLKSQFRRFVVPEPASSARTGTADELNLNYQEPTAEQLELLSTPEEA